MLKFWTEIRRDNKWPCRPKLNGNVVVVVSGMQLTIAYRHTSNHLPQRAVLGQICCFWERIGYRWFCFRSCWTVLSHVMRGRPSCLLQSAGDEANRILLASALSSMRIICPNKVSRRDWIIAVTMTSWPWTLMVTVMGMKNGVFFDQYLALFRKRYSAVTDTMEDE